MCFGGVVSIDDDLSLCLACTLCWMYTFVRYDFGCFSITRLSLLLDRSLLISIEKTKNLTTKYVSTRKDSEWAWARQRVRDIAMNKIKCFAILCRNDSYSQDCWSDNEIVNLILSFISFQLYNVKKNTYSTLLQCKQRFILPFSSI